MSLGAFEDSGLDFICSAAVWSVFLHFLDGGEMLSSLKFAFVTTGDQLSYFLKLISFR